MQTSQKPGTNVPENLPSLVLQKDGKFLQVLLQKTETLYCELCTRRAVAGVLCGYHTLFPVPK